MQSYMRCTVAGIFLSAGLVLSAAVPSLAQQTGTKTPAVSSVCGTLVNAERFARTELFFGLSKPDGSQVTEAEFQNFVDTVVTPLFPDGLTLLSGAGQFQGSSGEVIQEGSKLLILLYTFDQESSAEVEQIRQEYKDAFQQQSVLRVDEPSCVSF